MHYFDLRVRCASASAAAAVVEAEAAAGFGGVAFDQTFDLLPSGAIKRIDGPQSPIKVHVANHFPSQKDPSSSTHPNLCKDVTKSWTKISGEAAYRMVLNNTPAWVYASHRLMRSQHTHKQEAVAHLQVLPTFTLCHQWDDLLPKLVCDPSAINVSRGASDTTPATEADAVQSYHTHKHIPTFLQLQRATLRIYHSDAVLALNRFAQQQNQFDILAAQPMDEGAWRAVTQSGKRVCDLISLELTAPTLPFPLRRQQIEQAVRNGLLFEVNLSPIFTGHDLTTKASCRLALMQNLQPLLRHAPPTAIVVTLGAQHPTNVRTPYDIAHVAALLGITNAADAQKCLNDNALKVILKAAARKTEGTACVVSA